jgi:hypothetical protein
MLCHGMNSDSMNLDKIYSLGEQFNRRALRAIPTGDALIRHRDLSTGAWEPQQPVVLRQARAGGSTPMDLVGTEVVDIRLFSNRAIELLRSRQYNGWKTYPVELLDRHGERISGYQGFAVVGRCGPVEAERSERITRTYGKNPLEVWRGLLFDPSTWDGSDIFQPRGTPPVPA